MDSYTKLAQNMAELGELFTKQMHEHDLKLQEHAQASSVSPKSLQLLTQEFGEFKTLMWKALSMIRSQLDLLTDGLDHQEMYSRRKILLFHGVDESKDEDVVKLVHGLLADKLQMPIVCVEQAKICHRLGIPKKDKTRPILVRFSTYEARRDVWSHKTALKGTGITISEFLTKSRHNVFMEAREHFGINNCWTMDGTIILLLPDGSRRKVHNLRDLMPLKVQFTKDSPGLTNTSKPRSRLCDSVKQKRRGADSKLQSLSQVQTRRRQQSSSSKSSASHSLKPSG